MCGNKARAIVINVNRKTRRLCCGFDGYHHLVIHHSDVSEVERPHVRHVERTTPWKPDASVVERPGEVVGLWQDKGVTSAAP